MNNLKHSNLKSLSHCLTELLPIYQKNIGPSDSGTIILSTHRPTVLYWRLSDFIHAFSFLINFMGKNPWKFGQKQCTVHKGLYFLEKELSWSLKLGYTVTVLLYIFFVYYFYATSGELGCRGVRKCHRPCRTWIWLM